MKILALWYAYQLEIISVYLVCGRIPPISFHRTIETISACMDFCMQYLLNNVIIPKI